MNMKKLLFVLASAVLLASCATTMSTIISYTDYSKYDKEGFFVSPTPYYNDYTPCGEVYISVPAYQVVEDKDVKIDSKGYNQYGNYVIGSPVTTKSNLYTRGDLVDLAVEQAKKNGADALVNFKVGAIYSEQGSIIRYEIFGFCIKRK